MSHTLLVQEKLRSLFFDAGYCCLAIGEAKEAFRCLRRASETAYLEVDASQLTELNFRNNLEATSDKLSTQMDKKITREIDAVKAHVGDKIMYVDEKLDTLKAL